MFFTLYFNSVEGWCWKRIVPVPTPPSAAPSPHLLLFPALAADRRYLNIIIHSNNSFQLLLSLPLPFTFTAFIYVYLTSKPNDIYHFLSLYYSGLPIQWYTATEVIRYFYHYRYHFHLPLLSIYFWHPTTTTFTIFTITTLCIYRMLLPVTYTYTINRTT
jgi:hypothetical protein